MVTLGWHLISSYNVKLIVRWISFFEFVAASLIKYMTLVHLPFDCSTSLLPLQPSDMMGSQNVSKINIIIHYLWKFCSVSILKLWWWTACLHDVITVIRKRTQLIQGFVSGVLNVGHSINIFWRCQWSGRHLNMFQMSFWDSCISFLFVLLNSFVTFWLSVWLVEIVLHILVVVVHKEQPMCVDDVMRFGKRPWRASSWFSGFPVKQVHHKVICFEAVVSLDFFHGFKTLLLIWIFSFKGLRNIF